MQTSQFETSIVGHRLNLVKPASVPPTSYSFTTIITFKLDLIMILITWAGYGRAGLVFCHQETHLLHLPSPQTCNIGLIGLLQIFIWDGVKVWLTAPQSTHRPVPLPVPVTKYPMTLGLIFDPPVRLRGVWDPWVWDRRTTSSHLNFGVKTIPLKLENYQH